MLLKIVITSKLLENDPVVIEWVRKTEEILNEHLMCQLVDVVSGGPEDAL